MFPVILALTLLGAPPDDIAGPSTHAPSKPPPRRILEITRDVDQLVRRESKAQTESDKVQVTVEMTRVYLEIKRDPRLAVSDPLKDSKIQLWNKLTRIKKDVKAKIKREGRPDHTLTDEQVLALADVEVVTQALADHIALTDFTLGGPSTVLGQSGAAGGAMGGGAGSFDYGPSLVDLIQRTIVPDFWDVNGGPGTIVYYRPLMCLVVRATSDVHHRLGGTLDALGRVR